MEFLVKLYLSYIPGIATVLNRGDMSSYGTMFKIVPETTQDFVNRMTCFKIPGTEGATVTAQGILPDVSEYKVCRFELIAIQ